MQYLTLNDSSIFCLSSAQLTFRFIQCLLNFTSTWKLIKEKMTFSGFDDYIRHFSESLSYLSCLQQVTLTILWKHDCEGTSWTGPLTLVTSWSIVSIVLLCLHQAWDEEDMAEDSGIRSTQILDSFIDFPLVSLVLGPWLVGAWRGKQV